MRYLIDTDHASLIQLETVPEFSAISRHLAVCTETDIVYSIITVHEQFLGSHDYIQRARSPADAAAGYERFGNLVDFYQRVPLVSFNNDAAAEFARHRAARVRISTMDLRIASIATARGLVVVTRNRRDFEKVPNLITEDWTV